MDNLSYINGIWEPFTLIFQSLSKLERSMAFLLSNLLCLFAVASILATTLGEDSIILRPSYGAIFEKIGKLDNTNSFWYHTIAIPIWRHQFTNWDINLCQNLPDPKTATRDIFDDHQLQLLELCNTYPEIFGEYSRENNQIIDLLLLNEAALQDLQPPPIQDTTRSSRHQRAILPLWVDWATAFFVPPLFRTFRQYTKPFRKLRTSFMSALIPYFNSRTP